MHKILNVNTLIQCFPATLPQNIDRRSATNYGINTQKFWHFLNIAKKSKYSWKDKKNGLLWYTCTSMYKLFISKFSWQNLAVILLRSPLSIFWLVKFFTVEISQNMTNFSRDSSMEDSLRNTALIIQGEKCQLWRFPLCNFLHPHISSNMLDANFLPRLLFLQDLLPYLQEISTAPFLSRHQRQSFFL
jgi:hypothetical protein